MSVEFYTFKSGTGVQFFSIAPPSRISHQVSKEKQYRYFTLRNTLRNPEIALSTSFSVRI